MRPRFTVFLRSCKHRYLPAALTFIVIYAHTHMLCISSCTFICNYMKMCLTFVCINYIKCICIHACRLLIHICLKHIVFQCVCHLDYKNTSKLCLRVNSSRKRHLIKTYSIVPPMTLDIILR